MSTCVTTALSRCSGSVLIKGCRTMLKLISCVALLSVISAASYAEQRAHSELFTTIEAADAKLFRAYNECDLSTFGSLVDGDVEFFHDVAGVSQGRKALLDALEK